jgi:fructose-1,6-bisphosphatase/inositol monophosphatase family enzyme
MRDPYDGRVPALMRSVAAEVVLPHYRSLAAQDITEKEPDDFVTIADRLAEERLTAGLRLIDADVRVIGEEAVAADPGLLQGIERGALWLVDPIDGTGNYAAGRPPFAIMIALVRDGDTEAGWILDPLTGRLCQAVAGRGAFVNGERVLARPSGAPLPIASLSTRFLTAELRSDYLARTAGRLAQAEPPLCAGEQYPRVVLGENDVALFWRTNPWDHAAGALFVSEAGGLVARADRVPYRIGDTRPGLLAAANPVLWDETAGMLWA